MKTGGLDIHLPSLKLGACLYLTPGGTFDVSVSTAAIFLASKPEPAQ